MKTVDLSKNRALAGLVRSADGEPVILTKSGKALAAIIPMKNGDMERISLATNSDFLAMLEDSRAQLKSKGGISAAEMRKRLKIK